jgi:D-lactate dehydrogenase
MYAACETIQPLIDAGAEMVELMDRASLRAIENTEGIDPYIRTMPQSGAALLIEFQEAVMDLLSERVANFVSRVGNLSVLQPPRVSTDGSERDFIWKVRKGLFPSVGAVRASGTTVVLEDVAFPIPVLGNAILDLQKIFKKFAYHDAIIFGHAKDGNIHFVITQSFDQPSDLERYRLFLEEIVELVVHKYNGTLKAEHGTGRNMAPFVETEWGKDAYDMMKRIKMAADPGCLLNPGVIINEDAEIHLKHIKRLPVVEEEVDKCIECGYCEHKCPSREITLTPRRRIVVRRALKQMKEAGETGNYQTLLKQYQYSGLDTCAVDGLCATACPVDINTGDLVKRLRREKHSSFGNAISLKIAKNFRSAEWAIRFALKTGMLGNQVFGKKTMIRLTSLIRKMVPSFPLWTKQLTDPPGLGILKTIPEGVYAKTVVYFPTCISRTFGSSSENGKNIIETFISVAGKAGFGVIVSPNIKGLCCGQVFSSKGYRHAFGYSANKWIGEIWKLTDAGQIPVITDLSSCTQTLHSVRSVLSDANQAKFDQLKIMDSIEFLHDFVIPVCRVENKKARIVVHPVCSLEKMGIQNKFKTVAHYFAREVVTPVYAGCCGMAGDRGFIFPELARSATLSEAHEVKKTDCDGFYSSSKTCEMALSEATDKNYESVLYLADACMV